MKTQAQRLPVDVKVTDLEKLRDTRAQKRAEDEAFSYNPQRLGMFRRDFRSARSQTRPFHRSPFKIQTAVR